jgi:hypothetical protein
MSYVLVFLVFNSGFKSIFSCLLCFPRVSCLLCLPRVSCLLCLL